jgi:glycosyltransferase involved in cell wall biosynthesis
VTSRVFHLVWTFDPAGAERIAHAILSACTSGGFEPHAGALAPASPEGRAFWGRAGIALHDVPKGSGLDLTLPRRLAALLRERGISILHTHNAVGALYGGWAAQWANVRHVHTEHSNVAEGKRALRWLARARLRRAIVVADSHKVASVLVRRDGFVPSAIRVIANGIDLPPPPPIPAERFRRELALPEGARVVGTVGNLRAVKNQAMLIEAFAPLASADPHLHLAILGEGSERGGLEERLRALRLEGRVHLAGRRDDARSWLGHFDLFVLPSLSEGLPLSLLEAMAAGCPVIASSVGGIPEAVGDGREGLLVPPGSAPALTRAMRRLLRDRALARLLGEAAARTAAERFDGARMTAAYLELYRGAA